MAISSDDGGAITSYAAFLTKKLDELKSSLLEEHLQQLSRAREDADVCALRARGSNCSTVTGRKCLEDAGIGGAGKTNESVEANLQAPVEANGQELKASRRRSSIYSHSDDESEVGVCSEESVLLAREGSMFSETFQSPSLKSGMLNFPFDRDGPNHYGDSVFVGTCRCGAPFTLNDNFCRTCGDGLHGQHPRTPRTPPEASLCTCGHEFSPTCKFCRACGEPRQRAMDLKALQEVLTSITAKPEDPRCSSARSSGARTSNQSILGVSSARSSKRYSRHASRCNSFGPGRLSNGAPSMMRTLSDAPRRSPSAASNGRSSSKRQGRAFDVSDEFLDQPRLSVTSDAELKENNRASKVSFHEGPADVETVPDASEADADFAPTNSGRMKFLQLPGSDGCAAKLPGFGKPLSVLPESSQSLTAEQLYGSETEDVVGELPTEKADLRDSEPNPPESNVNLADSLGVNRVDSYNVHPTCFSHRGSFAVQASASVNHHTAAGEMVHDRVASGGGRLVIPFKEDHREGPYKQPRRYHQLSRAWETYVNSTGDSLYRGMTSSSVGDGRGSGGGLVGGFVQLDSVDAAIYKAHSVKCFVITPTSLLRSFLDVSALLFMLHDVIVMPLQFFEFKETLAVKILLWMTTLFWTLNVPFNFISGYTMLNGDDELRLHMIVRHYIRTWLPIDLLTVIVDWLTLLPIGGSSDLLWVRAVRALRMIRLVRLAKAPEKLELFFENVRSEKHLLWVRTLGEMLMFLMFTHVLGCGWYGLGNSDSSGWVYAVQSQLGDKDSGYLYALSYHWALTNFASSMDVNPQNLSERIYAVASLVVAFFLSVMLVSSLTSSMTQLQFLKSKQTAQAAALRRFLLETSISQHLRTRIQANASFNMNKKNKTVGEGDVELLRFVSPALIAELHCEMYFPIISAHPLFDVLGEFSPNAARQVCHTAVTKMAVTRGDLLFSYGESPAKPKMIFVCSGQLVYTKQEAASVPVSRSVSQVMPRQFSYDMKALKSSQPVSQYSSDRSGQGNGKTVPCERLKNHKDSEYVSPGQWCCEPAIWLDWTFEGMLCAFKESDLLLLDADSFRDVVVNFRNVTDLICPYAKAYVRSFNRYGGLGDLCTGKESSLLPAEVMLDTSRNSMQSGQSGQSGSTQQPWTAPRTSQQSGSSQPSGRRSCNSGATSTSSNKPRLASVSARLKEYMPCISRIKVEEFQDVLQEK